MADHDAPVFDMKAAKVKFAATVDNSRKGRKTRHKAVSNATDGRSLRSTGRTEHLNFKALPTTRNKIDEAAAHLGIPKSLWLEQLVHAAHAELFGDGSGDA